MRSSFEDLVARNTTAKTDFDLNIRFESYAFFKFRSDLHIFVTRAPKLCLFLARALGVGSVALVRHQVASLKYWQYFKLVFS